MKETSTVALIFFLAAQLTVAVTATENDNQKQSSLAEISVPENVDDTAWHDKRLALQRRQAETIEVNTEFSFIDEQPQSGIDFTHRIVDDAGKFYKAVHYDHGNGIVAADIDQDGLIDIYLVSQVGPNGLYRNLGGGRFENITAASGTENDDAIGVSASFADLDNDGYPDLYVTNIGSPNKLFRNNRDGTFTDISTRSRLNIDDFSSAAVFFDYDIDGELDLFLAVIGQYASNLKRPVTGTPVADRLDGDYEYLDGFRDAFAGHLHPGRSRASRLFKNRGKFVFDDTTQQSVLNDLGWSGAATPTDFDRNGLPDLYILNMQGHDSYWLNEDGQRFSNHSGQDFQKTPWGAMGVKSFDFNNDGLMDLMITDMHSDMSEKIGLDKELLKADWIEKNWSENFLKSNGRSIYGNALYKQISGQRFEEVSNQMNAENYWPWGLSVGDLNADGWQDMFITASMNYPFRYQPNTLLINNTGKRFEAVEYLLGIEPRRNERTSKIWFELDCARNDRKHPICQKQSGQVNVRGALGSRSSVIFDLDNDGDLDIVTNEFGDVPQVLISNLAEKLGDKLRYLKVRLQGKYANRDGLGARVTLVSGEKSWTQVHDGQSGYLSQSSLPLYFGLSGIDKLDYIDIEWPGGTNQKVEQGIKLNSTLIVEQTAN